MASFDPIDFDPHEPPPRPDTPPVRRGFLLVLFFLSMAALMVYGVPYLAQQIGYRYEVGRAKAAEEALATLDEEGVIQRSSALFRLASTRVQPAVVNVRTSRFVPGQPNPPEMGGGLGQIPVGSGSGVVVDKERGFIVTNEHVIKDADGILVRLGRREFPATLVGSDSKTDLAVLQVKASLAAEAQWGDSDALDIGEWVLAIGSPFELDRTVTAGIVSATGRAGLPMFSMDFYQDFVQTDAAINPGNSGGPLINLKGQVVGINTAILSETGSYQGIGLAISSTLARRVVEQLIEKGRVVRGYLGISMRNLQPGEWKDLNVPESQGVFVAEVVPGSPAEMAGLQAGDVVLELDGTPIQGSAELRNKTLALPIDQPVPLILVRDGEKKDLQVTIREMPILLELGLRIRDLPPEILGELPDKPERAVVIEAVLPGSQAARAGLVPGLRLMAIGDIPIATTADADAVATSRFRPNEGVSIQVSNRAGDTVVVQVGGPQPGIRQEKP